MTARLPLPPDEPPRIHTLDDVAPRFRAALERALAEHRKAGWDPVIFETVRTDERQAWLYGFGRDYDDVEPRGIVTHARSGVLSWHKYGLAADIISAAHGWEPHPGFWRDLGAAVRDEGLRWGGDWFGRKCDRPHVQWGRPMRDTPSFRAIQLRRAGGNPAVWKEVHAL